MAGNEKGGSSELYIRQSPGIIGRDRTLQSGVPQAERNAAFIKWNSVARRKSDSSEEREVRRRNAARRNVSHDRRLLSGDKSRGPSTTPLRRSSLITFFNLFGYETETRVAVCGARRFCAAASLHGSLGIPFRRNRRKKVSRIRSRKHANM